MKNHTRRPSLLSSLMAMLVLSALSACAQSPFFQAVTNLNPVSYWPLQETVAPPIADVETNLGALGPVGNAFYSSTNFIVRGVGGATSGDGDPAVQVYNGSGSFLAVPTTDPRVSLPQAPFTVEAWVYPTNTSTGSEAWTVVAQTGTAVNGGANAAGWGLVQNYIPSLNSFAFWGWTFHVFNGAGSTGGAEAVAMYRYTANTWYHLVGVYDGTNATLYVNGALASQSLQTGSYNRDTWDPLTIGATWSNTKGYAGRIDEVAIYTNALSATQIGNHYDNVGSATYAATVLGDNPYMYWRMDAPAYTPPPISAYPVAANYGNAASGNGLYLSGTTPGIAGPAFAGMGSPDYGCGFNRVGTDATNTYPVHISGGNNVQGNDVLAAVVLLTNMPATMNLTNHAETLMCWFRANPADNSFQNLIGVHGDDGARLAISSGALQWYSGAGGNLASPTASFNDGNWHFVVGVYTNAGSVTAPTGTNYLYVDGVFVNSAANTSAQTPVLTNFSIMLGGDPQRVVTGNGNTFNDRIFDGSLSHVAFFTNVVTAAQVANLYVTATGLSPLPIITGQPITGRTNGTAGSGTSGGPGSYIFEGVQFEGANAAQWYYNTTSNYAGATLLTTSSGHYLAPSASALAGLTSQQMTITNVVDSNSGYYFVVLTNNYGSVTSILASYVVINEPYITSQSPASGGFTLYTNQASALSVSAGGTNLVYQWYTNGVADASAGTAATYNLLSAGSGNAISGASYYCVVTNLAGAATSGVVTLTVAPLPAALANSSYGAGILAYNPSGYWPMHETNPPAVGDIETNYGSLGALGNGYYSDWSTLTAGLITHGVPGGLVGNANPCVEFLGQTNACLIIPHTSPLATISTPFTIEAWIRPFNDNSYSVILGQGGGSGLNGSANREGFALQYSGTPDTFSLVSWDGVGTASYEQKTTASYPPGPWYHLVCTYDGTNVTYYVNGSQASFGTLQSAYPGPMAADTFSPLVIGGGRWTVNGPTQPYAGLIDHVAIYTNIIQDVAQHYADGSSGTVAAYEADVQSDNPLLYYRMNSPVYVQPPQSAWPVLTNYGTAGVNGLYRPGVTPGGVSGPSESGIPLQNLSGNNAMPGNGIGGFADAGFAATFSPANYTSFSYTAWFQGNPVDNRSFNTIMCVNDASWRAAINSAGKVQAHGGADITSPGVYNDGRWHQMVLTCQGVSTNGGGINSMSNNLYMDGVLVINSITATNNPASQTQDVLLGSSAPFTNSLGYEGRSFAGNICEAAFFYNTVLNSNQVLTLYNSAGVAPFITTQPISTNLNASLVFTNTVQVSGGTPLSYQWYKDGQPLPLPGQTNLEFGATNASLVFYQLQTNDASADYYVVVANQSGAVTSSVVSLGVYGAPIFTLEPLSVTLTNSILLFSNASPTFKVVTFGAQPTFYQWYTNQVLAAAGGPGSTNYILPPVQLGGGVTNLFCVASNFLGVATNNPIFLTGIPAPIAPYPVTVMADNPVNYWRLDEGPDNGNGNGGTIADDYWGGQNGIYTNTLLGQTGYSQATDPTETSAGFGNNNVSQDNNVYGINDVDFSAPATVNSGFSIEAWVNGYTQTKDAGIVSKGWGGGGEQYDLDTGSDSLTTHGFRFFVRDAAGGSHLANSAIPLSLGTWFHLVGVCNESNGAITLYVNGLVAATTTITTNSGILSSSRSTIIGSRPSNSTTNDNDSQFNGYVDDVAIYNYPLSAAQIETHYAQAGVPPAFTQIPSAIISTNGLAALSIPAALLGTPPMGYYWQDQGAGTNFPTVTTNGPLLNATLTIASLPTTWNQDTLVLTVTNAYGSTNYSVSLNLFTNAPVFALDLPPVIREVSGRTYTYSVNVLGPQPYGYQWYGNNLALAGSTGASLPVTAGAPGSVTNFYVIVTNVFGAATSSISVFTSVPTNSYQGVVAALNPVGFWPLQENPPAAPATVETNLGSLGVLGNAYYYYTNNASGQVGEVSLAQGGVTSDGDYAASFSGASPSVAIVPRATPALTLTTPMSLECWINSSSAAFSDILGESGGGYDAANNAGNYGGVRLSYGGNDAGGPNLQFYVCNGSGTTRNAVGTAANSLPMGQWHQCVATYDGTNTALYIDGVQQIYDTSTLAGTNTLNPDTWTPFSIGGSFWQTNSGIVAPIRSYNGLVDEVAVYTNILNPAQVSAHYAAASTGSYAQTIINDRPLLYYRMDCPGYTNPPASLYPIAVNYGSAPVNGNYPSGLTPAGVSGPPIANSAGATVAAPGNGFFSCVDAGVDPSFNISGTNKCTALIWFRAYPIEPRLETIMSHGGSDWAINLDGTTGHVIWTNSNAGSVTSSSILNDGAWHFLAGVEDGRTNYLYVDGVLNGSAALLSLNGLTGEAAAHIYIGGNQDFTNPILNQRYFDGAVAEAALLTNALTAAQVQQTFDAAFTGGAPYILTNVITPFLVMPGDSVSNSVFVIGQAPLAYQWQYDGMNLSDVGGVTGSHSNVLGLANANSSYAGNYQVIVTNNYGSATSGVAVLTVGSLPISIGNTGPGWTLNQVGNYTIPAISNGVVTLSDSLGSQARSFFFQYPQYIGAFKASFTYQASGNRAADGIAFCIQNDPRGPAALGGDGGSLGVSGITPSAELEMNVYATQGMGYIYHTNGATTGYIAPGSVNFASGDPIGVSISYAAGQMSVLFTDAVASVSFSASIPVGDLTEVVGNSTAYVGFTGADGGSTAIQTISNFSFVSIPPMGFLLNGGASGLAIWPGAVAGYELQQNATLGTTNWVTVTNPVVLSNNLNQVTVPLGGSNLFYRLVLP